MPTYRERRERRAARLRDWGESRDRKAQAASDRASAAVDGIPFGQPILVGHHSEGAHRRAVERSQNAMGQAVESHDMAERHREKADNIEKGLDRSIYSDDPDAIEQLEARIEALETQRARMKAINKEIRAGAGWADRLSLSDKESRDLEMAARFHHGPFKGYPSYAHIGSIYEHPFRQFRAWRAVEAALGPLCDVVNGEFWSDRVDCDWTHPAQPG